MQKGMWKQRESCTWTQIWTVKYGEKAAERAGRCGNTQRNTQRGPDRDLKRKKMGTFRPFGKRENEIKLGSVLKKDAQT